MLKRSYLKGENTWRSAAKIDIREKMQLVVRLTYYTSYTFFRE